MKSALRNPIQMAADAREINVRDKFEEALSVQSIFEEPHDALLPSAGRQAIAATIRVDGDKFNIWIDLYRTGPVLSIRNELSNRREPLSATSTSEYASSIERSLLMWYRRYERSNAYKTR